VAGDPERPQLELTDIHHAVFARLYARVAERKAARDENRTRLLGDLTGRVLEFPHPHILGRATRPA
jgi:hypothetical protein